MLIKIIHIQITREVLEIAGAAVRVGITTDEIGKEKSLLVITIATRIIIHLYL